MSEQLQITPTAIESVAPSITLIAVNNTRLTGSIAFTYLNKSHYKDTDRIKEAIQTLIDAHKRTGAGNFEQLEFYWIAGEILLPEIKTRLAIGRVNPIGVGIIYQ